MKLNTVGDVEKISVDLINEIVTDDQERREHSHEELKKYLKIYAKDGITGAIAAAKAAQSK